MTDHVTHLYWDSCVIIRYLIGSPLTLVPDIRQHLADAKNGRTVIHFSTVALAEIKPSHLKEGNYGSMQDFLDDWRGALSPIDPTPNIMIRAGALRDLSYRSPRGGDSRVVGTADAIHFTTCLHVRDVLKVPVSKFHTFDDGKGRRWEEKCVPLLSFHEWTNGHKNHELVNQVCSLDRCLPAHPEPKLV